MEEVIAKVAEQAPGLVVLVWSVMNFLKHIQASEARQEAKDRLWNTAIADLTEQYRNFHSEQRDRAYEALDRASAALLKSAAALAVSQSRDGHGELSE